MVYRHRPNGFFKVTSTFLTIILFLLIILYQVSIIYARNEILKGIILYSNFELSCGRTNDRFAFKNTYLVLTFCKKHGKLKKVHDVANFLGLHINFAECDLSINKKYDPFEVLPILQWIISNWEGLTNGSISKVLFHHAHEKSWHIKSLSTQLWRLFYNNSHYFCQNEFGEFARNYIDHDLNGGPLIFRNANFFKILKSITEGTSFSNFNNTNSKDVWRSGRNSAFFISSSLIIKHPLQDYQRLVSNIKNFLLNFPKESIIIGKIQTSKRYLVAETMERAWNVLFTNHSYIDYYIPESLGEGSCIHFSHLRNETTLNENVNILFFD